MLSVTVGLDQCPADKHKFSSYITIRNLTQHTVLELSII